MRLAKWAQKKRANSEKAFDNRAGNHSFALTFSQKAGVCRLQIPV
jgi:hypothetical protein